MAQTGRCEQIQTETMVGLANGLVEVGFDIGSGALVSLRNRVTGDEYIKDPGPEGNPFRVWAGITKAYTLNAAPESLGGEPVEPAMCRLVDWSFERVGEAGVLKLVLHHVAHYLRFELQVRLPDEEVAADCTLTVRNDGDQAQSIMTAFPYLSGLRLGEQRESNLGLDLNICGAAGQPAWVNTGGIYGRARQMPMQWQAVYEPTKDEGLGFIVMDPDIRNKIIRRFPPAGMSVLYFPPEVLKSGEEYRYPTVRLLVHRGDWRVVARRYRQWFEGAFKLRQPPRWLDEVDLFKGSGPCWIPFPEAVAKAKQHPEAPGAFTSFRQLPRLYLGSHSDLTEWAMYNSLVLSGERREAPQSVIHADGTYYPREDIGGVTALREGVAAVHRIGRRMNFYVEGLIVHKDSELTLGGGGQSWTRLDAPGHEYDRYKEHWHMCPGCEEWQDHLAEVCKRLLWQTGADGIRLDSLGNYYVPCYNPAHHHDTPFGWNQWIRQLFRKVRAAMDEVNPQATLWTEQPVDFYHEYCDAALVQFCPGRDLAPMRLAVPSYRGIGYSLQDGGTTVRALNGWPGGIPHACAEERWWPDKGWYKVGLALRWYELRATFREALLYGDPTDIDPRAPEDPEWVGRLWRTARYWLLVGGHLNASALKGPTRVKLPQLPDQVQWAYEFDAATLEMREAQLTRAPDGTYVTMESGFGAVLLPLPDCPPLVQMDDLPALSPGQEVTVDLNAFAPWREKLVEPNVTVTAPGLEVDGSGEVTLPASVQIKVPEGTEPGKYFISVSGDCLPLKRWVEVKV